MMPSFLELPPLHEHFETLILDFLQDENPISEYALMQNLAKQGLTEFKPDLEPLAMFRAHFLLFHLLYRLQDKWAASGLGWLDIHTTAIQFTPQKFVNNLQVTIQPLSQADSVKDYYLDYSEFLNTQESDVLDLLDDFWQKMGSNFSKTSQIHDQQAISKAQKKLDLEGQVLSLQTVKQQFRFLCQHHHPDKGGNPKHFREICEAKDLLLDSLKNI